MTTSDPAEVSTVSPLLISVPIAATRWTPLADWIATLPTSAVTLATAAAAAGMETLNSPRPMHATITRKNFASMSEGLRQSEPDAVRVAGAKGGWHIAERMGVRRRQ